MNSFPKVVLNSTKYVVNLANFSFKSGRARQVIKYSYGRPSLMETIPGIPGIVGPMGPPVPMDGWYGPQTLPEPLILGIWSGMF